jgi:hypothetical protein
MRSFSLDHGLLTAALTGLAVVAFATPSVAGTVYKWTTESGTTAFTDDAKRIPARYAKSAERQQTGTLSNYSRFTVAEQTTKKPYAERVESRIESLRQAHAQAPAESGPAAGALRGGAALNVGIGGQDQLLLPLGGDDSEPLTIEEHRVRLRNSIATQDVRVTRRGDQVQSVTVSTPNQRSITERNVPGGKGLWN